MASELNRLINVILTFEKNQSAGGGSADPPLPPRAHDYELEIVVSSGYETLSGHRLLRYRRNRVNHRLFIFWKCFFVIL